MAALSSIHDFSDGKAFEVQRLPFKTSHLYMELAVVGDLAYKRPSRVGWEDFHRFVESGEYDTEMIRPLDPLERASNRAELAKKYPSISQLNQSLDASSVRWLLIHRLQYNRMVDNGIVSVPQSRFVAIKTNRWFFWSQSNPTIVQERIHGTSVWDMRDHNSKRWKSEWQIALQQIGGQLLRLVNSPLRNHINWNIKNFVFCEADRQLYYVDCTPSAVFARTENEQNINCIRRDFA